MCPDIFESTEMIYDTGAVTLRKQSVSKGESAVLYDLQAELAVMLRPPSIKYLIRPIIRTLILVCTIYLVRRYIGRFIHDSIIFGGYCGKCITLVD
jgi:hypothetical protein